jgi:heme/copper-type cytochrome/quinol oxidase subunit 2
LRPALARRPLPPPGYDAPASVSLEEDLVSQRAPHSRSRTIFAAIAVALAGVVASGVVLVAQAKRDFDVVARKYNFRVSGNDAPEIRVTQNDLVHITFSTEDIPHSFTIEDPPYRIMRKAEPGKPVSFDSRADTPGRFRFFCNLTIDEKCKDMQGTLIVERAR